MNSNPGRREVENGTDYFINNHLIVLAAVIVPHAITPITQIEIAPTITPAAQNFPHNNTINQINTLTAAPTLKVTSTPRANPKPAPTPNSSEVCRFLPVPALEQNPIILILTGLLGILHVSRKGGNFS
jgi:hypothetical protein